MTTQTRGAIRLGAPADGSLLGLAHDYVAARPLGEREALEGQELADPVGERLEARQAAFPEPPRRPFEPLPPARPEVRRHLKQTDAGFQPLRPRHPTLSPNGWGRG